MKIKLLCLAVLGALYAPAAIAAPFVNLTPKPKQMTVSDGSLTLPASFTIGYSGLSDEMAAEITKFTETFNHATGLRATPAEGGGEGALFTVSVNGDLAAEGYNLKVTGSGVTIEAATSAGLYYAFQTVKKVLPANVMVNVADHDAVYSLPIVDIKDEPRYEHRGYELDCARHFFETDQVKKMIDVMSFYKMNRLHWHLTDDQGWRLEIPKYPKLITKAATAPNAYWWDFKNHYEYYLNEPYGPFYYTVDELKDIVAYAKEHHIEVIPEVDMPGHMEAAISAYPEFSCDPGGSHSVRYWPGVSTDILNVANPAVIQFCKDVMDQLVEIFPYEYIHIGGDECPKTAWQNSAEVQDMMARLGLDSPNALQTWLTKEIADYVKPKGKRLICWNEVLTSEGADTKMLQDADVLIYDWLGGTRADGPSYQAAKLGLRSVWCSTYHYYIDYSQWSGSSEPKSMGGPITLETMYNVKPSTSSDPKLLPYYYGVQCNLWTEYISEPEHVEYNSLPRMIAVAETGWTPDSRKNFNDFKARFNADTEMLDLAGYTYGRHYVENSSETPELVYPQAGTYYRLVTRASHDADRRDRCIELVRDGSPLISSNSAAVGRLWTNSQAAQDDAAYQWQFWTFEPNPSDPSRFAMVCKAVPDGSVNPAMTGSSVNARWSYDNTAKHYNFVLGEHFGQDGGSYYYSVRSDKNGSWWLNCAQAAQNLSVNNWNDPVDGNGGLWTFMLEDGGAADVHPEFDFFATGQTYMITDAMPKYAGISLVDAAADGYLRHGSGEWGNNAWIIEETGNDAAANVQSVTLRNAATGRYIGSVASAPTTSTSGTGFFNGNAGYAVNMAETAPAVPNVDIFRYDDTDDFVMAIGGKNLYPLSVNSMVLPGTVASGSTSAPNATRNQGAAWTLVPVTVYTYNCVDAGGASLATFHRSVADGAGTDLKSGLPEIENHTVKSAKVSGNTVTVTYERVAHNVTYVCRDSRGIVIDRVPVAVKVGETHAVKAPELPYCTYVSMSATETEVTPSADMEIETVYSSDAYFGVKAVGDAVTELKDGYAYLIYDAHAERHAYRYASGSKEIWGSNSIEGASPFYTWLFEARGSNFAVKNLGYDLYMPAVGHGSVPPLTADPYAFTFRYRSATDSWQVKNSGNGEYWDGNEGNNLTMAGWTGGGHPYRFHEFTGEPFFKVTVVDKDQDGNLLGEKSIFVAAGGEYLFATSLRPGYIVTSVTGAEGLDAVSGNKVITVTFNDCSGLDEIVCAGSEGSSSDGIYDLNGRRLRAATVPGVYIVNGQKMILK